MIKENNTTEVNTLSLIRMSSALSQVQGSLANMSNNDWEYDILFEAIEFLNSVIIKPSKEAEAEAFALKEFFTELREGETTNEDAVKCK